MEEKFLPVGSVVLLKGATKRLMITGFCTMDTENQSVMYDYCGCLYPEGMISSDETALFNHDQIEKVFHVGLSDQEEKDFKIKLKQLLYANSVVTESAPASVLNKDAIEEDPVPPIGPGLPEYVAPKIEAAPATPAAAAQPEVATNIQFDE